MHPIITSRRLFLSAPFAWLTAGLGGALFAQGGNVAELRDQLESGLKVRRPEEFRFIARVLALVDADRLPIPLVRSTFHWARKKAAHNGYPFVYFERGMRIRAARLGIRI